MKTECKYCGSKLKKVMLPANNDFQVEYFMVCFNDDCEYYVRGWEWMKNKYNVVSSYRYKFNPVFGDEGPLHVESPYTFKDAIVE